MTAYTPAIGDIVRSGPGQTRFTVLECGAWIKLAYPNLSAVIYRRADALTLVQAALRIVPPAIARLSQPYAGPTTRTALVKHLRTGDVLILHSGERVTVRNIWGGRGVRINGMTDWRYTVWVTDAAGRYRQIGLSTMGPVTVAA
jgi:hypothetical protein